MPPTIATPAILAIGLGKFNSVLGAIGPAIIRSNLLRQPRSVS